MRAEIRGHVGVVFRVRFHRDGKLLATCGIDGTVRIWDLIAYRQIRCFTTRLDAVYDVDFSPAGSILAATGCCGKILLWNHETSERLKVLRFDGEFFSCLTFSPDGRVLGAGTSNELVFIVNMAVDLDKGKKIRERHGGP